MSKVSRQSYQGKTLLIGIKRPYAFQFRNPFKSKVLTWEVQGFKSGFTFGPESMSRGNSYTSTVCFRSVRFAIALGFCETWLFYLTHYFLWYAPLRLPKPFIFSFVCLFWNGMKSEETAVFLSECRSQNFFFLLLLTFSFYSHSSPCQTKQPPLLRPISTRSKARTTASLLLATLDCKTGRKMRHPAERPPH